MADDKIRNQIVVISHTGTKTPLFCKFIINKWHTIDDCYNAKLSIKDIVCSTQVQQYILPKTTTVDIFFSLGDLLNEGTGNNGLINYLSNLYLNSSDFEMAPICSELKTVASIQNYYFICKH